MEKPDEIITQEQQDKLTRYGVLNRNVRRGEILFTGSSLMEQFPINELLMTNGMNQVIYNRGIGGFTTNIKDRRVVLIIDEFPFLAGTNPSIKSMLQHEIDHHWKEQNLFFILCGSSVSFMVNDIMGY